jgi:hypothetical protein
LGFELLICVTKELIMRLSPPPSPTVALVVADQVVVVPGSNITEPSFFVEVLPKSVTAEKYSGCMGYPSDNDSSNGSDETNTVFAKVCPQARYQQYLSLHSLVSSYFENCNTYQECMDFIEKLLDLCDIEAKTENRANDSNDSNDSKMVKLSEIIDSLSVYRAYLTNPAEKTREAMKEHLLEGMIPKKFKMADKDKNRANSRSNSTPLPDSPSNPLNRFYGFFQNRKQNTSNNKEVKERSVSDPLCYTATVLNSPKV